ncbi:hypothetical protein IMG5_004230 [Ichthyophthirius multifiliis]|uniref:Uncharacterized protein n=1 Tax=Ichthyophthirius multifiliis TaxID=5932 RepID=G0QJD5_ICHMU|nr:hypothetical protein IMG5_004230 [Ichthyophthirius multifiliis]EGR34675.1 hypothetical protein IMG5_004230 [Ichthyophthirius multifiliis]|eukprot:XP_004039979.1 hypothetical protein IMG5_004230 [Ichthyophthirius multifiliis]
MILKSIFKKIIEYDPQVDFFSQRNQIENSGKQINIKTQNIRSINQIILNKNKQIKYKSKYKQQKQNQAFRRPNIVINFLI